VNCLINSIHIKNFKSIKEQHFELSPITILIGPNGSGKSSVLQALAVLKGFIEAPNRALDNLFALHFINMGRGVLQRLNGENLSKFRSKIQ